MYDPGEATQYSPWGTARVAVVPDRPAVSGGSEFRRRSRTIQTSLMLVVGDPWRVQSTGASLFVASAQAHSRYTATLTGTGKLAWIQCCSPDSVWDADIPASKAFVASYVR